MSTRRSGPALPASDGSHSQSSRNCRLGLAANSYSINQTHLPISISQASNANTSLGLDFPPFKTPLKQCNYIASRAEFKMHKKRKKLPSLESRNPKTNEYFINTFSKFCAFYSFNQRARVSDLSDCPCLCAAWVSVGTCTSVSPHLEVTGVTRVDGPVAAVEIAHQQHVMAGSPERGRPQPQSPVEEEFVDEPLRPVRVSSRTVDVQHGHVALPLTAGALPTRHPGHEHRDQNCCRDVTLTGRLQSSGLLISR